MKYLTILFALITIQAWGQSPLRVTPIEEEDSFPEPSFFSPMDSISIISEGPRIDSSIAVKRIAALKTQEQALNDEISKHPAAEGLYMMSAWVHYQIDEWEAALREKDCVSYRSVSTYDGVTYLNTCSIHCNPTWEEFIEQRINKLIDE